MDLPRDKDYVLTLSVGDPDMIRLQSGDITKVSADVIVNAANSELAPGGGVCGAIHHAGGPTIAEECHRIVRELGRLSPGEAAATAAGSLPAKHVIHAVGPVWRGGKHSEAKVLSHCYRESMRIADELKLHSIAFPAISTGIYGYPVKQAAWVALPTLIESLQIARHLVLVYVVLFDKETLAIFSEAALAQRKPVSGDAYSISLAY